jgi:hypothetical protein
MQVPAGEYLEGDESQHMMTSSSEVEEDEEEGEEVIVSDDFHVKKWHLMILHIKQLPLHTATLVLGLTGNSSILFAYLMACLQTHLASSSEDNEPPRKATHEGGGVKACLPRSGKQDNLRTYGMLYGFCNCGFMLPPVEMVSAESTTQVIKYPPFPPVPNRPPEFTESTPLYGVYCFFVSLFCLLNT